MGYEFDSEVIDCHRTYVSMCVCVCVSVYVCAHVHVCAVCVCGVYVHACGVCMGRSRTIWSEGTIPEGE